jgi:hypothetical protein
MLLSLQSEGLLGEITDEIKYGISKKIRKDLGRAIEEVICNKEIYEPAKTTAKADSFQTNTIKDCLKLEPFL